MQEPEQHKRKPGNDHWDIFVAYANEDREAIAGPLAEALRDKGLAVWSDGVALKPGRGLQQFIDGGVAHSRFGVVVLSKSFFAQHWSVQELDSLANREVNGEKVILPIWHSVGFSEVWEHSPVLADRRAVSTDKGVANVAERIVEILRVKEL
jgi:hypothetical protein